MMQMQRTALALTLLFGAAVLAAQTAPAIGGYCPVAYSAMGEAVHGDEAYSSVHHGQRFLFVSADGKKMFDADPEQYVPAYDGYCATAVANGMKVKSDPKLFTVHKGRTYLFSNAAAKKMFDAAKDDTAAQADSQWPAVKKKPETSM